jgi:hypothetical protein
MGAADPEKDLKRGGRGPGIRCGERKEGKKGIMDREVAESKETLGKVNRKGHEREL